MLDEYTKFNFLSFVKIHAVDCSQWLTNQLTDDDDDNDVISIVVS